MGAAVGGVQVRQVAELAERWAEVPLADALELLSDGYSHVPALRAAAARSVAAAPDWWLQELALPLTLALRFDSAERPHLADALVGRAARSGELGMRLFWCLAVERAAAGSFAGTYRGVVLRLLAAAQAADTRVAERSAAAGREAGDAGEGGGGGGGGGLVGVLQEQEELVGSLLALTAEATRYREARPRQMDRLRALLAEGGAFAHLAALPAPVPLPHMPTVKRPRLPLSLPSLVPPPPRPDGAARLCL